MFAKLRSLHCRWIEALSFWDGNDKTAGLRLTFTTSQLLVGIVKIGGGNDQVTCQHLRLQGYQNGRF